MLLALTLCSSAPIRVPMSAFCADAFCSESSEVLIVLMLVSRVSSRPVMLAAGSALWMPASASLVALIWLSSCSRPLLTDALAIAFCISATAVLVLSILALSVATASSMRAPGLAVTRHKVTPLMAMTTTKAALSQKVFCASDIRALPGSFWCLHTENIRPSRGCKGFTAMP